MDETTSYVHDHVVNHEFLYNTLMQAVRGVMTSTDLAIMVHHFHAQAGLNSDDLVGVDYVAMVDWERNNG